MKTTGSQHSSPTILVLGANGQIGSELVEALAERYGPSFVIASDLASHGKSHLIQYEKLNALDNIAIADLVKARGVTQVYLLAAALSARGETRPRWAWELNTGSLLNILELAREVNLDRIFWPSSIAAFGPSTPRLAPQTTVMDPNTVYGLSKLVGERWCSWYHSKHGIDVRSLRYPGLISYKAPPGGGTTDYAIEMVHAACGSGHYNCFIAEHQALPLMYMPDALRATLELMHAPSTRITERGSYNVTGFSATPAQLAASIRRHLPNFTVRYEPDFRQSIAASWPCAVMDDSAQRDWKWAPQFNLDVAIDEMLLNLPAHSPM